MSNKKLVYRGKKGAVKRKEVGAIETIEDVFARHLRECAEVNAMWDAAERELFGGTVREMRTGAGDVKNIPGTYSAIGESVTITVNKSHFFDGKQP